MKTGSKSFFILSITWIAVSLLWFLWIKKHCDRCNMAVFRYGRTDYLNNCEKERTEINIFSL